MGISTRPLGALERAVMACLWAQGPCTVPELCQRLAERGLAYTTWLTTLDRLHKKGLLSREKEGHAFRYTPTMGPEAYERQLVAAVLADLPTASREAVLSGFLDYAAMDEGSLEALERLLDARKRGEE